MAFSLAFQGLIFLSRFEAPGSFEKAAADSLHSALGIAFQHEIRGWRLCKQGFHSNHGTTPPTHINHATLHKRSFSGDVFGRHR